ncbi:Acetylornithine aminotransferase [Paenibacillus plantiphilus]|uniref:Acetylornithine aminotransferase n=1 Tax=Paenibacillus plantiphilus TaxID=2905650 RepID=A0ABN8GMM1_9BACL|nr:acetylornithine/succinylornithine family transaminase [Paenibacillus plantiphilus]CAH1207238.1 Acetylornithine aminotransferase [Paenibacillus plantiphilus]
MSIEPDTDTARLLDAGNETILFTANRPDIVMERGEGLYLWDTAGKKYLDFVGGWAVVCLGHSPFAIKKALEKQAATLVNASPAFYNRPMIEFAKRLTEISRFDKVFFASSGAEANEGAIKLARKHGARNRSGAYEIITVKNGFHGRTLATMSATGKQQWAHLYEPKVPGFLQVPFNDIEAMQAAVGSSTCAIMLELVQGEGGVRVAEEAYIAKLRQLCDENGVLLIFDEIQTGLGRTGKMFAYEHYGIQPDIMTLGKGIGGGFPLSAVLTKAEYNLFEAGDQGGTYSGQPLAMAVGIAVLNEIIDQQLADNAEQQGNYILQRLEGMRSKYQFQRISGKGLLIAFDLQEAIGRELVEECMAEGLLINSPHPHTIRLIPPLTVSKAEIDDMFDILTRVMDKRQ